jgi:hypothetical protein
MCHPNPFQHHSANPSHTSNPRHKLSYNSNTIHNNKLGAAAGNRVRLINVFFSNISKNIWKNYSLEDLKSHHNI